MGPRAYLDRCGKSCPHRDSIPGPSSLQIVAIPTKLPGPLMVPITTAKTSKYIFTILNITTFSVHIFYTLLQPTHLSCFLFHALWSITSQQKEAVLHIQHQMKVRLPVCSSFTPEDRACSTHKAPFALWVHSQSGKALFFALAYICP